MKILKLHFKNLNSLYGEWLIDFQDSQYTSSGIFGIFGPTGSGKTTILDAICLALYGRTPRLNNNKSLNISEIKSEQTSECFAEVIFSTGNERYRCFWSLQSKKSGKYNITYKVFNDLTDETITDKKKEVDEFIERKTSMKFDQFTQACLLAQGDFDKFLSAPTTEKAAILENITGGSIYRRISKRVFTRTKEEITLYDDLKRNLEAIALLTVEEEEQKRSTLHEKEKENEEIKIHIETIWNQKEWRLQVDRLQMEYQDLELRIKAHIAREEAFQPDRERLNLARKAARIEVSYQVFQSSKQVLDNETANLESENRTLPEKEKKHYQDQTHLDIANKKLQQARTEQEMAQPEILALRAIIQNIVNQKRVLEAAQDEVLKLREDIRNNEKKKTKEENNLEKKEKELKKINDYLDEHSRDEILVSEKSGLLAKMDQLLEKGENVRKAEENITTKKEELDAAVKEEKICRENCIIYKNKFDSHQKDLEELKLKREFLLNNRTQEELESNKEELVKEITTCKIYASLEDHRSQLEEGKACPLCGSLHHPFARENVPTTNVLEEKLKEITVLLDKLKISDRDIEKKSRLCQNAENILTKGEGCESVAKNNLEKAQTTYELCQQEVKECQEKFEKVKKELLKTLKPFDINDISIETIPQLKEHLEKCVSDWNRNNENKKILIRDMETVLANIKTIQSLIENITNNYNEKNATRNDCQTIYDELEKERQEKYGDRNPDVWSKRLNTNVQQAEEDRDKSGEEEKHSLQILNQSHDRIKVLEERIDIQKKLFATANNALQQEVLLHGFSDVSALEKARINDKERDNLEKQAKDLDQKKTELNTSKNNKEKELSEEKAKNLTDRGKEGLEEELKIIKDREKIIGNEITTITLCLKDNDSKKAQYEDLEKKRSDQEKKVENWKTLNELIGSSSGNNYVTIVQGLTITQVVSAANKILTELSHRYIIIHDNIDSLGLKIKDQFQMDLTRSTNTLSGGEKFLVSLALALGLSSLKCRKSSVDSLFLDEGFGALDEEKLNITLDLLNQMQQNKKIIGIISHMKEPQDKISTQIQVFPVSPGRSKLSGPGVTRIQK